MSKKVTLISGGVFLATAICAYLLWFRPYSAEVAADSNAKLLLQLYNSAQKAYSAEHGTYALSLEKFAFDPKLDGTKLYLNGSELPEAIQSMLPPACLPFTGANKYRIVVVSSNSRMSHPVIWMSDPSLELKKLPYLK